MGLLDNFFKGNSKTKKEEKKLPWQQLTQVGELQKIKEASKEKLQVIFKHSTRCGISKSVINRFVSDYDLNIDADLYYLDLLNYREVSNEVGHEFQVIHQSPQLILVKGGKVIHHASHHEIYANKVLEYI
ncbi:bacillithiol system redox-active protein YtxJ [Pseudofulvibacter geojedonensis]|uniref:Bacillithiol system redox-active protein YtxJ n=1 Tax=Pseudofulvibacter geojedonensis TaxID=1123758 RepID=A0ABW3HZI9_9FLAO